MTMTIGAMFMLKKEKSAVKIIYSIWERLFQILFN